MRRNRAKAERRVLRCGVGIWCRDPPRVPPSLHTSRAGRAGVNRARSSIMRARARGGRAAPPAGLITWQIAIGSLIACAPGAGAPLGPPRVGSDAEGEGQGVGMSGDARTLSPPHLASCGSLLWSRRRRRSGDRIPSPRTLRPAALIVVTVSDRGMAPDPADDLPPRHPEGASLK